MKVTVELLKKMYACPEQRRLFSKIWPNGVVLTKKVFTVANEKGLNTNWFFHHIAPMEIRKANDFLLKSAEKAKMRRDDKDYKAYEKSFLPFNTAHTDRVNKAYSDCDVEQSQVTGPNECGKRDALYRKRNRTVDLSLKIRDEARALFERAQQTKYKESQKNYLAEANRIQALLLFPFSSISK